MQQANYRVLEALKYKMLVFQKNTEYFICFGNLVSLFLYCNTRFGEADCGEN